MTPRGHQKAATDAFLAQFNAVENGKVLAVKPATQSLRTASSNNMESSSFEMLDTDRVLRQIETYQASLKQPSSVAYSLRAEDSGVADMSLSASPDTLNNKGYSSVMVQNIHAVGSVPNNYDGAVEGRQSVQTQLAAVNKAKSPRFLRRLGGKGGA